MRAGARPAARLAAAALAVTGLIVPAATPVSAAEAEPSAAPELGAAEAARFAELALACVHQEYPNKIAHTLQSDADVASRRAS